MHIGIDVDGVLRRLVANIKKEFLKDHPKEKSNFRPVSSLETWGIENLAESEELGQKIREFAFSNPKTSFRCFRNADVVPGTPKEVAKLYKELKEENHVLSICTSQSNVWQRQATMEWLHENLIPFDNVIMTGTGKGHFGLDYLFDDRVKNCVAVEQNGGRGVLKNRTYNRHGKERLPKNADTVTEYKNIILS